jgi:hypothetical protein
VINDDGVSEFKQTFDFALRRAVSLDVQLGHEPHRRILFAMRNFDTDPSERVETCSMAFTRSVTVFLEIKGPYDMW